MLVTVTFHSTAPVWVEDDRSVLAIVSFGSLTVSVAAAEVRPPAVSLDAIAAPLTLVDTFATTALNSTTT